MPPQRFSGDFENLQKNLKLLVITTKVHKSRKVTKLTYEWNNQ